MCYFQDTATTNSQLTTVQRCSLHAVVASLLTLIPFVMGVAPLQEYADQVSYQNVYLKRKSIFFIVDHHPSEAESSSSAATAEKQNRTTWWELSHSASE